MIAGGDEAIRFRDASLFQCELVEEEKRQRCLALIAECDRQKGQPKITFPVDDTPTFDRYETCLAAAPRIAETFPLHVFRTSPTQANAAPQRPPSRPVCSDPRFRPDVVRSFLKGMLRYDERDGGTPYFSDSDTYVFLDRIILPPFARCGRFRELRDGLAHFYQHDLPPKHVMHAEERNAYALWATLKVLNISLSLPAGTRFDRKTFDARMNAVLVPPIVFQGATIHLGSPNAQMGVNLYFRLLMEGVPEVVRSSMAIPDDALLQHLHKAGGYRRPWIEQIRQKYR